MRYTLLQPFTPTDIRKLDIASTEELRSKLPSISDHDLESEAISAARDLYPDAVAMPVPLKIGSGETVLMGILPSIRKAAYTKDDTIPFVLFVQATSQSDMDRQAIKKHRQFQRSLWRTPVLAPKGDYRPVDLEMRFHDMEQPMKVTGAMFRRADKNGGRVVLYIHTENGSLSIEMFDPIPLEFAGH